VERERREGERGAWRERGGRGRWGMFYEAATSQIVATICDIGSKISSLFAYSRLCLAIPV